MPADSPLKEFAEAHGLAFAERIDLPKQGDLLSRDGKVEGTATGALPGDVPGTLAHFTYTYTWTDSDNHTHHEVRRFTVVVTQLPESIGFMPYLGFSGADSKLSGVAGPLEEMRKLDLGNDQGLKDTSAYAFKGASENWTAQLLSPALVDWLARSDADFGFELGNGVLCVARNEYLNEGAKLETLCGDAAHLATAIREESLEDAATGGAEADAAKDPDAADPKMDAALSEVAVESPLDAAAARPEFAGHLRRSPGTFFGALKSGVLLTLVLNVPGIAVPILLVVAKSYVLLAVIEAILIALITFLAFRKRVAADSQKYAAEAFYRGYAKDRELAVEEPLKFAATHAEAKLPFKPDRVFSGPLPGGGTGSLVLCGDGTKRADRVAVVGGPRGPIAESELEAEPPGLSAKDLDVYFDQLSGELREAMSAAGAK